MRDIEFSPPGEEFAPPAPEFAPPGREHSRAGREFGQYGGAGAPAKKRRRLSGLMLTAAAVATVTMTAALSGPAPPAGFPQPVNFTAEFRAYLDDIMTSCQEEDDLALHRLASSPTAGELWRECLGPYQEELHALGCPLRFYYDGSGMTPEPGEVPALTFQYAGEEAGNARSSTLFTYFRDGSRRHEGTWGVDHMETQFFGDQPPSANLFAGELREDERNHICLDQGAYRSYNSYSYTEDAPDAFHLDRSLEGTFSRVEREYNRNYLEDGVWTMYFRDGGQVKTAVADGSIILNEHLEPDPAETPGLYQGITIRDPGPSGGVIGWRSQEAPCTLEELLYRPWYLFAG